MKILAVAHNTFREAVRDKVLYVLLFFAGATILGSKILGWISVGQDIKIVKDVSLASLLIFGVLIAIFIGTHLVYKEIDKRTLYTILARPVRRYEFILGKYVGLISLLALVVAMMSVVASGYLLLLGGELTASFFYAVLLVYMELLVVTALAILMSSLSAPILGAIIVFCVFMFGHATTIFVDLPPQLQESWARPVLTFFYYVVPNLENFNVRAEAANGVPVAFGYVLWAMGYAFGYASALLAAAALVFEGKDV